jgi:hypothetical protein
MALPQHQELRQRRHYHEAQPQIILMGSLSNSAAASFVDPNIRPFPEQELSLQVLNPFPESVLSYTLFLASTLGVWVLYLLLPRGFRKQYCRAARKRYTRRIDQRMPPAGYWPPARSMQAQQTVAAAKRKMEGFSSGVPTNINTAAAARSDNSPSSDTNWSTHTPPSTPPHYPKEATTESASGPPHQITDQRRRHSNPPSPEHPALKKIPPNKVIAETMARLQGRGIRLIAHGVHCDPKRVWIRLQDENEDENEEPSITWQTEFPRRIPNQSGQVSIVLMRGSLHKIALKNILFIDVGKKTQALNLAKGVPDVTCLSLLTQNGSLDLQANSKLERDSLVSCMSMILDDVHDEDWRALYQASPEPSLANSSTAIGGGGLGEF